jgi:hypothetical protein
MAPLWFDKLTTSGFVIPFPLILSYVEGLERKRSATMIDK